MPCGRNCGGFELKAEFISVVLLAILAAPGLGTLAQPSESYAVSQSSGIALRSDVVYIVQGQGVVPADVAQSENFYALHILSFDLPYDENRVYLSLPDNARNLTVWTSFEGGTPPTHGLETSGPMAGEYYVDVPSSHDRTSTTNNTTDSAQSFLASGSTLSNVEYSSGSLHLSPNCTQGNFVSARIPLPALITLVSANLTYNGTFSDNITCSLSNDDGVTWVPCSNGTSASFPSNGTYLRVRFDLEGNATLGFDPGVTAFTVSARYVTPDSVFTVHLSYYWTLKFADDRAAVNLSEPLPYSDAGSFMVMIYLLKGYAAQGQGVALVFDSSRVINTDPERELYYNSTPLISGSPVLAIEISAPITETPWALYGGVSAAALLILGVFVMGKRRRSAQTKGSVQESHEESPGTQISVTTSEKKKELLARKKELASQLDELESSAAESAKNDEYRKRSAELRKELKSVRNELNRLSRKAKAGPEADVGGQEIETAESQDSILASLAKLDDDFEKGRLPERSYRSLRKEYVERAAKLMAADKASALKAEKLKLMEAIVALEGEHERGEVEESVYKSLSAAYRKQLAEIMKDMDVSGREGG